MGEFYRTIDTILWGRKTCEMALDFQKRGVAGAEFDTHVKNYVFSGGSRRRRLRESSSWMSR